jgi:hypothetical protein
MSSCERFVCLVALILAPAVARGQTAKNAFQVVPAVQRETLSQRIALYTKTFRQRDWWTLFGLVSRDGKGDISKRDFVRFMRESHNPKTTLEEYPPRLQHFSPNRTVANPYSGGFDIYGCVVAMKYGDREGGVGVLHAVYENDKWAFTRWKYIDPGADCSVLADADWKIPAAMTWGEPMIEILCVVERCIL